MIEKITQQKKNGAKIVIYCAGLHGQLFQQILKSCGICVDFFADSDSAKWGKEISDGISCVSPSTLKNYDCVGFICVGKKHYMGIYEYVCKEKLFEVIEISDLIDDLVENNQELYFEVLRNHARLASADIFYDICPNSKVVSECGEIDHSNKSKIAVYTSVFGEYDSVCIPEYIDKSIEYFYVSDCKPNNLPDYVKWIDAGKIIPSDITSNVKRNRYIKMHPHLFLEKYKYSIYLDGNVIVKKDMADFIRESRTGIAVFAHPMRECIYYEALSIANFKRVDVDDVCRQMRRYLDEGMPCRYGLTEMPVIVREHMKEECIAVMETWWDEFNTESQRDQLSFMYALWKNKFSLKDLACIGNDVRNCDKLEFCNHVKETRYVRNDEFRKRTD